MGKKLVIVESPAKARTINKILGKDYIVKACMGHVRNLPKSRLGVDVEHDFAPQYTTIKAKQKIIKELRQAAKNVDVVYLAPDPDREGEAIAWHLMAILEKQVEQDKFFRVTYNEITASAIRNAFDSPSRLDQDRVNAQQARRVLDRIVGYRVSQLLWNRVKGGASAGRVQSVALRLVCEREKEILAFVKEKFWVLSARVKKLIEPLKPFEIRLVKINGEKAEIKQAETVEQINQDLENAEFSVSDIRKKQINKRPRPPFITSTLQQAASSVFHFSPSRSMRAAQKLYEGIDFGEGPVGLITYMRTDSFNVSTVAQEQAREFVTSNYGAEYVPEKPNYFKNRKTSQEAHEAIRPTDINRTPEKMADYLEADELKLYRLIWQRLLASQMASARIAQCAVDITAQPKNESEKSYLFRASSSQVLFKGYMLISGSEKKSDDSQDDLPLLEKGEKLDYLESISEEKETQPPARFTEASLIRSLEENGVGRPSTYAGIIGTLQARTYVVNEKRQLKPSDTGMSVSDFLVGNLSDLFEVEFTAKMEESLDLIENGKIEWVQMLSDFYGGFTDWLTKAKGPGVEPEVINKILNLLADIKTWRPPVQRGKRTYSDEQFVESLKQQIAEGEKPVSQRQVETLLKIATRHKEQLPEFQVTIDSMSLTDTLLKATEEVPAPCEITMKKLQAFENVKYEEPRQVGKRKYDDANFVDSLCKRVADGKALSVNQIKYLDGFLFLK